MCDVFISSPVRLSVNRQSVLQKTIQFSLSISTQFVAETVCHGAEKTISLEKVAIMAGSSSQLGSCQTSDLKIGTPVAALPGQWCYKVCAGTGWPSVSIR